jgi:hypothetical protein
VHHTTARLIVLFSASLFAVAGCDRDARRSNAPAAVAPVPPAPSDQAHPPAPSVHALTPSAPSSDGPSSPTPDVCPAIACFSGLFIHVYPQQGWPAGKYRFVIRHDRKTTVCNGRVPRPDRGPSLDIRCNSYAAVWEDGGFQIPSHPAVLDIDVVRDGVRFTHVHYDIEYSESWCGRPGCGRYRSARIDLNLPARP